MNLLWENEERYLGGNVGVSRTEQEKGRQLTARQIQEQLYPDATKSQHGTVQKLLQRLEDKGYIKRDRSLSVQQFSAAISRQTYSGRQLELLATKLTAGSLAPMITHLVEEKKISRDEISRIRAILDGQVGEEDEHD